MEYPTAGSFSTTREQRRREMLPVLAQRLEHHRAHCPEYDRMLHVLGAPNAFDNLEDYPWLPVGVFKELELRSVPADSVARVVTSSGTTGARRSRVFLDRAAALAQQRTLADTLSVLLGSERLPMLVVDSRTVTNGGGPISARGAGVLGLMNLGRHHTFVLDEEGRLDIGVLRQFLERHGSRPFLVFGFTFMVWLHLVEAGRGADLDLSNGRLLHSGGWKTLVDRAVDPIEFRRRLATDLGLVHVHNFYGMAEQIGVIHLEGTTGGHLYAPDFADVIVRDPSTLEPLPIGRPGLLEVVSTLPVSYPGNAILTEDIAVIDGVDDGDWPGPRFRVLGRLPRSEPRGCSDTAAATYTRTGVA